jgi:hypothetical protein
MPVCNYDIRIKNDNGKVLYFPYVIECEIESSWQTLTNTCTFRLPRKAGQLLNENLDKLLQVGNEVHIQAGYDDKLHSLFRGYITDIGAGIPLQIRCEDAMWKLKQIEIDKTWKKVTLQQLVQDIIPKGMANKCDNRVLGNMRYSKVTAAQVLKDLQENHGVYSYIRLGTLYCGFAYSSSNLSGALDGEFHFEKNIIEHNLEFKRKEQIKVRIDCISKFSNGKDIKYSYPSEKYDGEVHTLHSYEKPLSELKEDAQVMYNRLVYEGYRGSFTTFGHPVIDHGFVVGLTSSLYPEKNGKYRTDKVVYKLGMQGIKQTITVGGKA